MDAVGYLVRGLFVTPAKASADCRVRTDLASGVSFFVRGRKGLRTLPTTMTQTRTPK